MRVHHVRPFTEDQAQNGDEGAQVTGGPYAAAEVVDAPQRNPALDGRSLERGLARVERAVDEQRPVPARLEARVQQRHVACGAADVQPGDDSEDVHEWWSGRGCRPCRLLSLPLPAADDATSFVLGERPAAL